MIKYKVKLQFDGKDKFSLRAVAQKPTLRSITIPLGSALLMRDNCYYCFSLDTMTYSKFWRNVPYDKTLFRIGNETAEKVEDGELELDALWFYDTRLGYLLDYYVYYALKLAHKGKLDLFEIDFDDVHRRSDF